MNKQLLIAVPAFFCGSNATLFLWGLVKGWSATACAMSASSAVVCGVLTFFVADSLRNVR